MMNKPTPEKEAPPAEYTALNFDGTERRGNYRTVAYRIDILHICEHKDAAAILFEIIYRWQTEVRKPDILKEIERRKKAGQPPLTEEEVDSMMWVWMSYNDFVRECGGAIGYNTVIRMLDYLVETAQLVECRENHDPRYPDYEYRIRMDVLKEKLKALPAAPAFLPKVPKKKENKGDDSTQMGTPQKRSTQKGRRAQKSTQVGIVSTQMGTPTTQVGTEVYPNGGTSHTYSHTSHIQHTEEGTLPAHDHADSGATAPTAPSSHDSTSHENTEDEHGHTHTNMASHVGALPDRGSAYSQLASTANSAAGENHHHHSGRAYSSQQSNGRDERANQRLAPETARDGAGQQEATPPVADSNGYENTDEDTVKRPAVQLSTGAATSPQQSAKVEPKVLDVRTLTLKAHAAYIFQWLDIVKQEAKRDPRASYARTKTDEGRIVDLITSCWNTAKELTEENVRKAWLKMWNEPTWKNGFSWKKAGISIKAFCEHYSDYLEKAWDSEQKSTSKGSGAESTSLLPSFGGMTDEQYAAYLRG